MPAFWFISPTGSDVTGNGTSGNPWQSLSKAFTASSSGDVVTALAGTYSSAMWVRVNAGTGINFNWTVQGVGAAATIFDGGSTSSNQVLNAANITFQNLTIQNVTYDFSGGAGNPSNMQANFNNVIFNNVSSLTGIFTGAAGASANGLTFNVTACLFNSSGTVLGEGGGAFTSFSNFLNCTLYWPPASSPTGVVRFNSNLSTYSMTNCIFANLSGGTISWVQFGPDAATYGGSNNDIYQYTSTPGALSAGISADPLFVNAAGSNFNLRPSSPCIGTGTVI